RSRLGGATGLLSLADVDGDHHDASNQGGATDCQDHVAWSAVVLLFEQGRWNRLHALDRQPHPHADPREPDHAQPDPGKPQWPDLPLIHPPDIAIAIAIPVSTIPITADTLDGAHDLVVQRQLEQV